MGIEPALMSRAAGELRLEGGTPRNYVMSKDPKRSLSRVPALIMPSSDDHDPGTDGKSGL